MGSPPHTWRIRQFTGFKNTMQGITSTYVENTPFAMSAYVSFKDHLHIRGEYLSDLFATLPSIGSPPHTWRILALSCKPINQIRITSTYVENTVLLSWALTGMRDHLHIRGEYNSLDIKVLPSRRITSTYVENTHNLFLIFGIRQDHLHIRGEYWFCKRSCKPDSGSPPHTWRIQDYSD